MHTNRTKAAFLLATTLGLGWSSSAAARTLTYPSNAAPCNGTLQACIDGAAAGDRIEIASATRIEENITISRSLTLTGAPGIVPVIGSADPADAKYLDVSGNGEMLQVELRRLKLDGAYVEAYFGFGNENALTIAECEITNQTVSTSNRGIDLDVRAPGKISVQHNVIRTNGYGISLWTSSAGQGTFDIVGNSINGLVKGQSASGIDLSLRGSGKVLTNVFGNVLFDVADCNCGGASGIEIAALESAKARVFVTNNTLVDLAQATAIMVGSVEPTATLETYVFNNIVKGAESDVRFPGLQPNVAIVDGYNDFFGALSTSYDNGYPLATNNISVDPMFVDSENHDYRLAAASPLIDVAMSLPPGGLPVVDADDHVRLAGAGVDFGAYETGAVASSELALTAETTTKSVPIGGEVTFTLHVTATGPSLANDVSVTLPLPKGATLVSATSTLGTCSSTSAEAMTCTIGRMASGEAATILVVVKLGQVGVAETTATVSSVTSDPRSDDNTATLSVDVTGSPADGNTVHDSDQPANEAAAHGSDPSAESDGCTMSRGHGSLFDGAGIFGLLIVAGAIRGRRARGQCHSFR